MDTLIAISEIDSSTFNLEGEEMQINDMMKRLKRVHPHQSIRVKFKKGEDGIVGLTRLSALTKSQSDVQIDNSNKLVLLSVLAWHEWGADANRTVLVHHLQYAQDDQLVALFHDVESIQVDSVHGASVLCSARQKKQEEEANKLIGTVMTHPFYSEIVDWGMDVDAQLVNPTTDPMLEFVLILGNTPVVTIQLDGWSGRMGVNGVWGNELFSQPIQLQKLIRISMEHKLEEITA